MKDFTRFEKKGWQVAYEVQGGIAGFFAVAPFGEPVAGAMDLATGRFSNCIGAIQRKAGQSMDEVINMVVMKSALKELLKSEILN